MPYRRTPFLPGSYYHLYNRGNSRGTVFFTQENYLYFLRLIRDTLLPHVDIVAYVLMPNHYHLLVQSNTVELSDVMRKLVISYTMALNKQRQRTGAVFEGRFKSILVDRDEYLAHLTRYIHLNPVRAHLVSHPQDWAYSSFPEYIGTREGKLPKPNAILGHFTSRYEYQSYVETQMLDDAVIQRYVID
jgi:putative transposase